MDFMNPPESQVVLAPAHHTEIQDTLIGMGYDRKAVERVLAKIPDDLISVEEKVIYAIKSLAQA